MKAKLLTSREIAPEVRHFDFETVGSDPFVFSPGQFISVRQVAEGKEITRAYSIASPRDGRQFSLCLNKVADGMVSPYLFALRPGDEIDIHEPLGYFTLRHPGRRVVFVATGTGVAPFRSMLLDHLGQTAHEVTLLFGVRYQNGLLYDSEFRELAGRHPGFRYLPTVTRPGGDWAWVGRVQQHLEEALAIKTPEELLTIDVYICGLREMVDDVRQNLKARGFDRKQIIYEKYD